MDPKTLLIPPIPPPQYIPHKYYNQFLRTPLKKPFHHIKLSTQEVKNRVHNVEIQDKMLMKTGVKKTPLFHSCY